jgi:hypothetical protein
MNALFALQCIQDPELKLLKYSEFAHDPLGRHARAMAIELAKLKRFDDYTNAI